MAACRSAFSRSRLYFLPVSTSSPLRWHLRLSFVSRFGAAHSDHSVCFTSARPHAPVGDQLLI